MKNIIKLLLIILFYISMQTFTVAGGVYLSSPIAVNETATSAIAAKKNAFKKAKKQAWKNLLEDLSLLKAGSFPELDEETMNSVIRTLEVHGEKTRGKGYIANISIYFDPVKVRKLFTNRNILYVEERAFPVLVVPVFEQNGVEHIYDTQNLWEQAMFNTPKKGGLLPIFLAQGGVKNSLSIDSMILMNKKALLAKSKDFGVEGVIVSKVHVLPGKKGELIELNFIAVGGYLAGKEQKITMVGKRNATEESLNKLAIKFYKELELMWRKKRVKNETNGDNSQNMVFLTNNIEDWYTLKQQLINMPSVEYINLVSIQGGLVEIKISFLGVRSKIKNTLKRLGFKVKQKQELWVVERPL